MLTWRALEIRPCYINKLPDYNENNGRSKSYEHLEAAGMIMLSASASTPTTIVKSAHSRVDSLQQRRYHHCQLKTGSHYLRLLSPHPLPPLLRGGLRGVRQEQMVQSCGHVPASCPLGGPHTESRLVQRYPNSVYDQVKLSFSTLLMSALVYSTLGLSSQRCGRLMLFYQQC